MINPINSRLKATVSSQSHPLLVQAPPIPILDRDADNCALIPRQYDTWAQGRGKDFRKFEDIRL